MLESDTNEEAVRNKGSGEDKSVVKRTKSNIC